MPHSAAPWLKLRLLNREERKKKKKKKYCFSKKSQPVSSASNTLHLKKVCVFPSTPLHKVSCFKKTDSCLTEEQIQGWQSLKTACWLLLLWLLSLPACFALPSLGRGQRRLCQPRAARPTHALPHGPTARGRCCLRAFGAANLPKRLCWKRKRTFQLHRGMTMFHCCTLRLTTEVSGKWGKSLLGKSECIRKMLSRSTRSWNKNGCYKATSENIRKSQHKFEPRNKEA